LDALKAMHNPKSRQLQVGLSHSRDWHAWIWNLLIVAACNRAARTLNVLAEGVDVRRLETKEIGQGHNAMVVNNACCDGLAESKMNKHLAHLLFHVGHLVRRSEYCLR
jgi:hypothetical protein